jgi:hypothetical protein
MLSAIIIHSCRKETKPTQQEINSAIAAINFSVKDAATWFTGNKTALANKIKINSEASFLKDISDFTPVWDSARTALDTNYYVVEAPAKYAKKFGFTNDSVKTNVNGLTRLLVLKSKKYGNTSAVLMHIHGSPGVNAANVHYMGIPQNFSGNIFYTSIQGASINGYIYKEGKIIKVSSGKGSSTKPTGPQIMTALAPGECETIETDWYSQTCYYTGSDALIGCTEWTYIFSTFDTYCAPIGGGGGGGVPSPDDCPPGGGGSGGGDGPAVESVNGKLVVRLVAPGDGGGDSPCETCAAALGAIEVSPASKSVSSDIDVAINGDPDRRTVNLYWTFAQNPLGFWYYDSHERGVHHKVGNAWQYESLTHVGIDRHGVVIGGSFDITITDKEISVATITAGIQLTFYGVGNIVCKGVPLDDRSPKLTSHHEWSVNEVH